MMTWRGCFGKTYDSGMGVEVRSLTRTIVDRRADNALVTKCYGRIDMKYSSLFLMSSLHSNASADFN
jgi:hypothetical protein